MDALRADLYPLSTVLVRILDNVHAPILDELNIPYDRDADDNVIIVKGTNLIDLYGKLFTDPLVQMYGSDIPTMKVWTTDPSAVVPTKARESDVGMDLTIIRLHKELRPNIVLMYDTGIKIQVPWGYYVEVVPRSSFSKTGWMLANSIGIIDASYTGNIYVAVAKIDPTAPPLPLPFKGFQLILRKQYNARVVHYDPTLPEQTARGDGGFGSTGN